MKSGRPFARFLSGLGVLTLAAPVCRATAIVACAANDGVALVADGKVVTQTKEAPREGNDRKIAILRRAVAVASAGAGSFTLVDDRTGATRFDYDFKRWVAQIDAAVPAQDFGAQAVALTMREAARATFGPLGALIGAEGKLPALYFVVAGYERGTPVLYEIMVTGAADRGSGVEVTLTRNVPGPNGPVIKAEGFGAAVASGPVLKEAQRKAHLSSRTPLNISNLTLLGGWMIALEAKTNPLVGPPIRQVIIRPDGIKEGDWKG